MIAFLIALWRATPASVKAGLAGVLIAVATYFGFRIWLARHDASILKGYVTQARLDSANATVAELQRQKEASDYAVASYTKQLAKAEADQAAQSAKTEQEISDYEAKLKVADRACLLDQSDLDFELHY